MTYQCCKTKPLTCYVCINCHRMVHKSCLNRSKSKYRILNDHRIECCQGQKEDVDVEKSILEDTLRELTEESQLKTGHIEKLKQDHNNFLEEALRNEEELNVTINNQQIYIDKLLKELSALKEKLDEMNKPSNTELALTEISTQTWTSTRTTGIQTINTEFDMDPNKEYLTDSQSTEDAENILHVYSRKPSPRVPEGTIANSKTKPKMILIAGKHGTNCGKYLNNICGDKYSVSCTTKPHANITEIFETFTIEQKHLHQNDVVIIWFNEVSTLDGLHTLYKCLKQKICCKLLFLSLPYVYQRNSEHINHSLYGINLNLMDLCSQTSKINRVNYLECNEILQKNHFKGKLLKVRGKIALMKHILHFIESGGIKDPVLIPVQTQEIRSKTTEQEQRKLNKSITNHSPTSQHPTDTSLVLPQSCSTTYHEKALQPELWPNDIAEQISMSEGSKEEVNFQLTASIPLLTT